MICLTALNVIGGITLFPSFWDMNPDDYDLSNPEHQQAIWDLMMQPITVLEGDQTENIYITNEPGISPRPYKENCAGELHGQSQGVNVLAIEGVTKDTVFVVTYTATLNDDAVIGDAGNPNEVYLEFSNDPYSTVDSTGKTETDKVTVFTYQLTINKVDADQAPLKGAAFTLYKKNANGTYEPIGNPKAGTGENENVFQWKGLDDGDYKLVESTVPDGYNKMTDVEFTISAEHEADSADPKLTSLTSSLGTVTDGDIEESIENKTGTVLPETGAKGTMMLITVSTLFIMVAAVFMITRKKMSVYED